MYIRELLMSLTGLNPSEEVVKMSLKESVMVQGFTKRIRPPMAKNGQNWSI
jgi:hypothetical protein